MKFNEETIEQRVREMCENSFWADIYNNAPAGAKARLRIAFWGSKGIDEREDIDEYRTERERVENKMTFADADYLARKFPDGSGKDHYTAMRERLRFASIMTDAKLDEAMDRMMEGSPAEEMALFEKTREMMRINDDPYVKYRMLWAAVGGNGDECCTLGDVFEHGHGVTPDEDLAFYWFTKGAMCGDAESCCRLACIHEDPESRFFDFAAANFWYHEALRRESITVKWMLGYRLTMGHGEWEKHRNPKLGVELLKSALEENDDGRVHYYLGLCYEQGLGVEENLTEARKCFRIAARKHFGRAAEEAQKRVEEKIAERRK